MINRRLYLKTLTAAAFLGTLADIGRAAGDVRTQVTQKAAPEAASPRVLIVYFTWAGSTEVVAREIKRLIGGDLVRINRAEPYPTEYDDLGGKSGSRKR